MSSLEKKYFELFNKISDIIEDLKVVQLQAEEMYISMGELKTISNTEK